MTLIALALCLSPASAGDSFSDGPDDDGCLKGDDCIGDLTSNDYPGYVEELETMIDQLTCEACTASQLDAGYSVAGFTLPKGGFLKTADVWTKQATDYLGELERGHYYEHWFLDSNELLEEPGAAFALRYRELLEWPAMVDVLTEDQENAEDVGYLHEVFMKMDIRYTGLPATVTTAQLKYVGDSVEAFEFEGHIGEDLVAHMRREVHYEDGQVSSRYEHWLFLDDADGAYRLLDDPSETMTLSTAPAAPTTRDFYLEFQGTTNVVKSAAVISYTTTLVMHSGLFGDPGLGGG